MERKIQGNCTMWIHFHGKRRKNDRVVRIHPRNMGLKQLRKWGDWSMTFSFLAWETEYKDDHQNYAVGMASERGYRGRDERRGGEGRTSIRGSWEDKEVLEKRKDWQADIVSWKLSEKKGGEKNDSRNYDHFVMEKIKAQRDNITTHLY